MLRGLRCAVVGLGRVGTAVYRDLAAKGADVAGVDVDPGRVAAVQATGGRATTRLADAAGSEAWFLCTDAGPAMERPLALVRRLDPAPGARICVETTLQVGTVARLAAALAERGLAVGRDVYLVHAPHRIMLGRHRGPLDVPRVVGGATPACLEQGVLLYRALGARVVPVPDVRLAELSKLVENALRYVEVAFAEAVARYCLATGLDFAALRRAVNSRGNVYLRRAEWGIGGECLPKDLGLLQELVGSPLLAGARAEDALYAEALAAAVAARGPRVRLRGVGYKPGTADLRGSRALELAARLEAAGCQVEVEDPVLDRAALAAAGLRPARRDAAYDVLVRRGRLLPPAGREREGARRGARAGHR